MYVYIYTYIHTYIHTCIDSSPMSILAIAGLEVEGGDALPWHRVRVPHEEARRRVVHLGWGFGSAREELRNWS